MTEKKINVEDLTIFKIREELRLAADRCPNCQGAREYAHVSRGRENIVNCVRCEAIYKLLEPLDVALEMFQEEHPY